jgi:hypothetical protein
MSRIQKVIKVVFYLELNNAFKITGKKHSLITALEIVIRNARLKYIKVKCEHKREIYLHKSPPVDRNGSSKKCKIQTVNMALL